MQVENNLRKVSYKVRSYKQLYEWVNGNPIHNDIDKECCPDFSCCIGGGFAYPFNDYKNRVSYRDNFRKEKRKTIIRNVSSL